MVRTFILFVEFWHFFSVKRLLDRHVWRAVGSNRFAESRGVRHRRLWGPQTWRHAMLQHNALICLKFGWENKKPCHLPGCLWNGWSTACSTLLLLVCLFRFQLHVMIGELSIRFVRQLAQLGAPRLQLHCLFQHFWLTTMPVYLHRSWRLNGWQTLDLHSVIAYTFFFTESCKLGSVLAAGRNVTRTGGVSLASKSIHRKVGLVQAKWQRLPCLRPLQSLPSLEFDSQHFLKLHSTALFFDDCWVLWFRRSSMF